MKMKLEQNRKQKAKLSVTNRFILIGALGTGLISLLLFMDPKTKVDALNDASFSGSGYALGFDGTDDYAAIQNFNYAASGITTMSVEAWIKTSAETDQTIISFDNSQYWSLDVKSGNAAIIMKTNKGKVNLSGTATINDGAWHHIAAVFDNGDFELYVDGSLDASKNKGATFGSGKTRYGFLGVASQATTFDGTKGTDAFFAGELDEVRIWSTALTEEELRTNMCQKISSNETGLAIYYRFDENSGANLNDLTSNNYDATLTNFALTGTASNWVSSGASIGDTSLYAYGENNFSLAVTNKGTLSVSVTSGSVEGIHIYHIDQKPTDDDLPPGFESFVNDYWGVCALGGVTYTVSYDYGNHNDIPEAEKIAMAQRPNNGFSWTSLEGDLDRGNKKITKSGQNGTEYIMGGSSDNALPVELVYFDAALENRAVKLRWSTAAEINNDYFTIEKSTDGKKFELVANVQGAGNSSEKIEYRATDHYPMEGYSYYRLKQTDFDGQYKYFQLATVHNQNIFHQDASIQVFPNPSFNEKVTVEVSNLQENSIANLNIFKQNGSFVYRKPMYSDEEGKLKYQIETAGLSAGAYFITVNTSAGRVQNKLILLK